MKLLLSLAMLIFFGNNVYAHTTYTGYSGAPGSKGYCSQCHGSGIGTIAVSGIPANYQAGQPYTITVAHNSGSAIVNFNASTRIGTSTTVAGTFAGSSNTSAYSVTNYETGVHATAANFDTARYIWTAPSSGTGTVTFYISGIQGDLNGPSTRITASSTELTAGVSNKTIHPEQFALAPNYPNPFNPATTISYQLPISSYVKISIINTLGQTVAILNDGTQSAGVYSVNWDANGMPSGIYLYSIEAINNADPSVRYTQTRKMVLLK